MKARARIGSISAVTPHLYKVGGMVLFSIGFIGLFLPLLPTTIFWIGAALLYAKAHPELKDRIYARPRVGPIVEEFVEHGRISESAKNAASFGIVVVGGASLYLVGATGLLLWSIITILLGVNIYIHTRPSD